MHASVWSIAAARRSSEVHAVEASVAAATADVISTSVSLRTIRTASTP